MAVKRGQSIKDINPDEKILELGEAIVQQIEDRILSGQPANEIARWIQQDLNKCLDVKLSTVSQRIRRYQARNMNPKIEADISNPKGGRNYYFKDIQKISAMDRMYKLAAIQEKRLKKAMKSEEAMPVPMESTTKEIEAYRKVLLDLYRAECETGKQHVVPKLTMGAMRQIGAKRDEEEFFVWTEVDDRLLGQIEEDFEIIDVEGVIEDADS